jgi:hypothetical protein
MMLCSLVDVNHVSERRALSILSDEVVEVVTSTSATLHGVTYIRRYSSRSENVHYIALKHPGALRIPVLGSSLHTSLVLHFCTETTKMATRGRPRPAPDPDTCRHSCRKVQCEMSKKQ